MFRTQFAAQYWKEISISKKFQLGFSVVVTLILVIIAVSLVILNKVRAETETTILQSTAIQRHILDMGRNLEHARQLETQFFLRYPTLGYTAAYEQYVLPAAEGIDRVETSNAQLEALISASEIVDVWRENQVNLNLYRLAIDRHIATVDEATQLIAQLDADVTGLIPQLFQTESQLNAIIEDVDELELTDLFQDMSGFVDKYLFQRRRSLIQSAFNLSVPLREGLENTPSITTDQRLRALETLDAYQGIAAGILDVDAAILTKFNEFELQAAAIDPVTSQMIRLADQEILHAQERITRMANLANIAFVVFAVIGLGVVGGIAWAINRSITANIILLSEAASGIEAGNLDARVDLDSGDELGQFAATFNRMAARLAILVNDLEQQVAARTAEFETANQKLQLAMRTADEGLWEWNLDTNEVYFDDVALGMVGYGPRDFQGLLTEGSWWMEQVHPEDQESMSAALDQYLAGKAAGYAVEFRLKSKAGLYVWVASTGEVLTRDRDGHPEIVVGIQRNIDAHKKIDQELALHRERLQDLVDERTQELEVVQEKLIRRERLAVLGQLAGSVGHELRNPLAIIANAIYYLDMVIPDKDEKVGQYLEMIDSNIQEATQIVSDLLDFGRIKSIERKPIQISQTVGEVLALHPPKKQVEITRQIPEQLPPAYMDQLHLKQILSNLVVNAYQAMPDGGTLVVAAAEHANEIEVSVTDTGTGISPDYIDQIFEPLFTTKTKGIGLGLAICKNLVEANQGQIDFESQPGEGTVFRVLLPVQKGDDS